MASDEKDTKRAAKRSAEEKMVDWFYDQVPKDQARLIELFQMLHRLKLRQPAKTPEPPSNGQQALPMGT